MREVCKSIDMYRLFERMPDGTLKDFKYVKREEQAEAWVSFGKENDRDVYWEKHTLNIPDLEERRCGISLLEDLRFNGVNASDVGKYLDDAESLKYCEALRWLKIFHRSRWISEKEFEELIDRVRKDAAANGIHIQ